MAHQTGYQTTFAFPRPFRVILYLYVLGVLLFLCYRTAFFFTYRELASGVSVGTVAQAFFTGWRFDTVVILAVLAPVVLILPWLTLTNGAVRRIFHWYAAATFSLICLGLLADLRFYRYFDTHLNFQATQYLGEGETTWRVVVTEPMFWQLVAIWAVVSVGIWFAIRAVIRGTATVPERGKWQAQASWFVVFVVLTVIGIRGRLGISPIDWGIAYVTENAFINQLGLNGVYTLGRAFDEEGGDPRLVYTPERRRFPFVPRETAFETVQEMLGEANEAWLEPGYSLLRRTTHSDVLPFRPNIVLVVMESWSGRNTGSLGYDTGLTPRFDSLAADGILFKSIYSTGTRTNYGLGGIICAFPALPGRSVMTRYNANHPFIALSEIMRGRGYTNVFAYGGDLAFDNMQGYLTTKGYDRFYGDKDFGLENVFAKWGIPDHIVFDKTTAIADALPRPFQLTVLTLSNHEPFDLPDSSVQKYFDDSEQSKIYNAQVYADHALGRFIEGFKATPVFDSTVFVFVADHCKWMGAEPSPHPIQFHIPLLIYSPGIIGEGRQIETVGSQVDILPTLLGLLGDEYEHASWGRDLLQTAETDSGWATVNVANKIAMISGGRIVVEPLGMTPALYSFSHPSDSLIDVTAQEPQLFDEMLRCLHAYMQLADQMSTPVVP